MPSLRQHFNELANEESPGMSLHASHSQHASYAESINSNMRNGLSCCLSFALLCLWQCPDSFVFGCWFSYSAWWWEKEAASVGIRSRLFQGPKRAATTTELSATGGIDAWVVEKDLEEVTICSQYLMKRLAVHRHALQKVWYTQA